MDERHQYKSMGHLIGVLGGALLFGIVLPIAVGAMVKILFIRDGAFSLELANTWTTFQWIAAVVMVILAIAIEVFSIITVINIIKEFVRRRKEKSAGQYQSSVIQNQDYEY